MVASVHGTVDGLVLVGLGEGVLLGIVYYFAGVPHPVLLGALTAVAAMIPFGAPLVFGLAAAILLANGADWRTLHGFGDNACGSLSSASLNEPVAGGDWVGCAQALAPHLPPRRPDPEGAELVWIGERRYRFADEVAHALLAAPPPGAARMPGAA